MISCTQFIPAYSELFAYLEERGGYAEVQKYWTYISDNYVEPRLGECIREEGLKGCFTYWTHSLNEEAADFVMTLDEDEGIFEIDMRDCPSKGRLIEIKQIDPYPRYCQHCDKLYKQVVERYGFDYEFIPPEGNGKACMLRVMRQGIGSGQEQSEAGKEKTQCATKIK